MNKISLIFISIILLSALLIMIPKLALYISSGSDANPGTLEAPFKSIENAKSIRKLSPSREKYYCLS